MACKSEEAGGASWFQGWGAGGREACVVGAAVGPRRARRLSQGRSVSGGRGAQLAPRARSRLKAWGPRALGTGTALPAAAGTTPRRAAGGTEQAARRPGRPSASRAPPQAPRPGDGQGGEPALRAAARPAAQGRPPRRQLLAPVGRGGRGLLGGGRRPRSQGEDAEALRPLRDHLLPPHPAHALLCLVWSGWLVGFFVLILTLFSSIRCLVRLKSRIGWDLVLMILVFLLDGKAADAYAGVARRARGVGSRPHVGLCQAGFI